MATSFCYFPHTSDIEETIGDFVNGDKVVDFSRFSKPSFGLNHNSESTQS